MKLILYVNCLPTNYSLINLIFWFIFLPQKKKKSFFFCIDTKELQTNFFSIVSIVKKFGDCTSKCIDLMPQKGRFIARLLGRFNSVTLPSTRDVVASLPCTFSSIEFSMSAEVNKLFGLSLQNFQFSCNKLNIAKFPNSFGWWNDECLLTTKTHWQMQSKWHAFVQSFEEHCIQLILSTVEKCNPDWFIYRAFENFDFENFFKFNYWNRIFKFHCCTHKSCEWCGAVTMWIIYSSSTIFNNSKTV